MPQIPHIITKVFYRKKRLLPEALNVNPNMIAVSSHNRFNLQAYIKQIKEAKV